MKNKESKPLQKRYVRKAFSGLFLITFLAMFMGGFSLQARAADQNATSEAAGPPEFVDINIQKACPDIKGLKKDIKSVSHFSHKAHIEAMEKDGKGFICAACHHGAKSEADIIGADRCRRIEKELDAAGGPSKLKDYFHGQCLKCHKDLKKDNKPAGPTSCKGCHGRKGAEK